jgi:hypothetical protein
MKIDPEFRNQIPPLTNEEFETLEQNLIKDGCISPLIIWEEQGILLDGHNRYAICEKHNIDYAIREITLPDRDAALDWIDKNQLGRRNLKPEQISLIRGRVYNRRKKAEHDGGKGKERSGGQDVPQSRPTDRHKTAKAVAKEFDVSEKTIRRDGAFAMAVEAKKQEDPEIEQKIMKGEVKKREIIHAPAKKVTDISNYIQCPSEFDNKQPRKSVAVCIKCAHADNCKPYWSTWAIPPLILKNQNICTKTPIL